MAKRVRRNGEGTFWKSGKVWKAQKSAGVIDGKRRRSTRTFPKMADAVTWLKTPAEVAAVQHHSLGCWLDRWQSRLEVSENTAASYGYAIATIKAGELCGLRLNQLTPSVIDGWLPKVSKSRSRQIVYNVLRLSLAYAVEMQECVSNPCSVVKRPRHPKSDPDPFTAAEAQRIMKEADGSLYHAAVVLAFMVGPRQGELFGLMWADFDSTVGTLRIERQARNTSGKVILAAPKTESSKRTVSLTAKALDGLASHRRITMALGLAGVPLMFPAVRGGFTGQSTFRARFWRPLLKKLDIRYRGFHQCRHTFATLALSAGVPITLVSGILGHSNPSTTLKAYARWVPTDQNKATEAMQRLLG